MTGLYESYKEGIKQESENITGEINIDLARPKPVSVDDANLERAGAEDIEKANFKIVLKKEVMDGLVKIKLGSNADLNGIDEKSKQALYGKADKIALWAMPLYKSGEKKDLTGKGEGLVQKYFEGDEPTLQ
jgi:hypothetical protein